jgi:hypothetical protein
MAMHVTGNEGFAFVKEFVCRATTTPIEKRGQKADVSEPAILIRLTKRPSRGRKDPESLNASELYEATRRAWFVGKRRERAQFALAVSKGIVLEVYRITGWHPEDGTGRYEFEGEPAVKIRDRYVGKTVGHYFTPGSRAPFIYVNVPE